MKNFYTTAFSRSITLTFSFLIAITLMLFTNTSARAAGFASESEVISTAQTPFDKKYVKIDWHTSEGENVGAPLAFEDYLLLPTLNKVNKLSEKDGKLVATAELDEKVSTSARGVIENGLLIQPTRTELHVIDVSEMNVLCSEKFGEIITDVACENGLAYFGFKDGGAFKFRCVDAVNNLETVWEFSSEKPVTSAAKIDGKVVFGAGENLIVRAESGFIENPVGAEISHVFAGKFAVFMCCENGELRKLRLDDDGTAEENSLGVCELGGTLTAAVGVDNHIYVGSTEGFFVIDGLNMDVTKKYDELKNASAPILTLGSGVRAYTAAPHSDADGSRWYLYSVLDTDETVTLSELAKIIDFTDGKAAVSDSGRMFFRDAKGQVWAISLSKPSLILGIIKVILAFAILIMLILILRAWVKNRQSKRPPDF
ncbi:MAG: hypothetical protein K2J77_06550 [Oscillospiraceae bacterium]|nr:hypothetical protein [Oscillospiraceae bacterium]